MKKKLLLLLVSYAVMGQKNTSINFRWSDSINTFAFSKSVLKPIKSKSLVSLKTYRDRLHYINSLSKIKIEQNEIIPTYIERYLTFKWLPKTMGLGNYYFELFDIKLKKYNLPSELKYLPVIESNLNPLSVSRVGAKGLWQFMPKTGRSMGLYENKNISLFYDPVASTDAACRYFKYLFEKFNDWELVLAAYNAGEGTISKLIKKTNSSNYWVLRKHLPKETQAYVPSFLAVQYIMNFYESHNITPKKFLLDFKNISVYKAKKNIYVNSLYEKSKGKKVFEFINPHLKSDLIKKGVVYYLYN